MRDLGSIIGINAQETRADMARALRQGTISREHAASLLGELGPKEDNDEKRMRAAAWFRSKAVNRRAALKRSQGGL